MKTTDHTSVTFSVHFFSEAEVSCSCLKCCFITNTDHLFCAGFTDISYLNLALYRFIFDDQDSLEIVEDCFSAAEGSSGHVLPYRDRFHTLRGGEVTTHG